MKGCNVDQGNEEQVIENIKITCITIYLLVKKGCLTFLQQAQYVQNTLD